MDNTKIVNHHHIKEFIIIDNSSDEDESYEEKYPDFKFILKGPEEKVIPKVLI